jgi:nucleoside 2-deoxyribosyltransferase
MQCFVMMPFKESFAETRVDIRTAAARAGVDCIIADEIHETGKVTEQIVSAIRTSWACIADVSGKNPNVAWELGFAQSLGKPIVMVARSTKDLFFDLTDQRTIIYKADTIESREKTLIQPVTLSLVNLARRFESVPLEDLLGTAGHEKMSHVLAANRVGETQYGFFDILRKARKKIFLAAQNHYFFVEQPERRELFEAELLKFLRGDRERRVDIMLSDDRVDYAVKAWQYVTAERYLRDLNISLEFFRGLLGRFSSDPTVAGRLVIKRLPFVPLSINFVDADAELPNAFLVLTPNAYQAKNKERPCFVVSHSRNPEIFNHYWSAFSHLYNGIDGSNI